MTSGMKTVVFSVTDLTAAKQLYGSLLGVEPYADEAYYVGYRVGGQEIGLDPNGASTGMTGPVGYWHVEDIDDSLATLLADGAVVQREITDVGGGKRIAVVQDADGNPIGLLQEPHGVPS